MAARRVSCLTNDSSSLPSPSESGFPAVSRVHCRNLAPGFDLARRRRMILLAWSCFCAYPLYSTNRSCFFVCWADVPTVLNLHPAPLFSGIQFCLPSTCSTERTPQQTPGKTRHRHPGPSSVFLVLPDGQEEYF